MGKTENVFMLDSKDTRVGNSKSSVSNRLFSFSSEPETNFDVTADWTSAGVTDQSSFESFLTSQGAYSISISSFSLVGNRLIATMSVEGVLILSFEEIPVSEVNKVSGFTDDLLVKVDFSNGTITNFSPEVLQNSINEIYLTNNQIVSFNPAIPFSEDLILLELSFNQMTLSGYTASEAWALAQPNFGGGCFMYFNGNVDSITGTNLETILLTKNATIIP